MSPTAEKGTVSCVPVDYFATFNGYGYELSPHNPTSFEATQKSAGYVEVERDHSGKVAILRNVGITRLANPTIHHQLTIPRPTGTELFFEAIFDPRIDEHSVGGEIDYPATRTWRVYFAGKIEADDGNVSLRRYERSAIFTEVYGRDSTSRVCTALHFSAQNFPRVELLDGQTPLPLSKNFTGTRTVEAATCRNAEEYRQRAKQCFVAKNYDDAISHLEAALALVEGAPNLNDSPLANILCNLGTGWLYLDNLDRATYFASCGVELHAEHQNNRGVGFCTNTLALVFQRRKMAPQAAECFRQAARYFLQAGDLESREYALDQLHTLES